MFIASSIHHQFDIRLTGSAQELLEQARRAITAHGGIFEGDHVGGRFRVSSPADIACEYRLEAGVLIISITDKPFFIPAKAIEHKLREYLSII